MPPQNPSKTHVPSPLRVGSTTLRFDGPPAIMGILNVTPDSFSDGGDFYDQDKAIEHGLHMVEAGADLIDIGGESTRPGSESVEEDEELKRVIPIIEKLSNWCTTPISIDTTKARVAKEALDAGAAMVNDVSALRFDPEMAAVVAKAGVPLVLMHMRGEPKTMQAGPIVYDDLLGEIKGFLNDAINRAKKADIPKDKLLIDPGIGFGKEPEHNLMILGYRLGELSELGCPLLVGTSRKAFIGKVLGVKVTERVFGTAAAVAHAVAAGAHILRVHDVKPMREVALMAHSIRCEQLPRGV